MLPVTLMVIGALIAAGLFVVWVFEGRSSYECDITKAEIEAGLACQ